MAGAPFWAAQAAQRTGIEGSVRKVLVKCYQHGRQILQGVFQKGESASTKPKEVGRIRTEAPKVEIKGPVFLPKGTEKEIKPGVLSGLVYRASIQSTAGELRKRAALQFMGGGFSRNVKRTPIFAFVSLALSGSQSFEREVDPSENVLEQIRELFKPHCADRVSGEEGVPESLCLEDLEFGKMINKGCHAAVYEARVKQPAVEDDVTVLENGSSVGPDSYIIETNLAGDIPSSELTLTDIEAEGVELEDSDISIISDVEAEDTWVDVGEEGAVAVFSMAPVLTQDETLELGVSNEATCDDQFDLAVKMMFNYDVESNSDAILRAMEKEALPVKNKGDNLTLGTWENGTHVKKKRDLPSHPNIVDMKSVFVGSVPRLDGALSHFPDALPPDQNPEGFGRSKTMFLVMKKYTHTLREYLQQNSVSLRSSLLLFAQLLEGVVHMVQHGIAHRDLKSDNILIQENGDNSVHLVISDFGCCLAEEGGLKMPFVSDDLFRGGNRALMAPEIVGAVPGHFSQLEYSQSDGWAAGALGYEIFGMDNPFYRGETNMRLDSLTYAENELPEIAGDIPEAIHKLIHNLLNRNPKQRPIPEVAGNLVHLFLWAPEDWLSQKRPSKDDVTQWLLTLSAKALCQEKVRLARSRCFRQSFKVRGSWSDVEYQLVRTFLSRVCVDEMMEAIEML